MDEEARTVDPIPTISMNTYVRSVFAFLLFVLALWFCATACGPNHAITSGDTAYLNKQLTDAEQHLRNPSLTDKDRGHTMVTLGQTYSLLGRKHDAMQLWQHILSSPNVDQVSRARAQHSLALMFERDRNWNEAITNYLNYCSLYQALSEQDRDTFDQISEHHTVVLFHVGELQEHQLREVPAAAATYGLAVELAEKEHSPSFLTLIEYLGDFHVRQRQYDRAVNEYTKVSAAFQERQADIASPVTRPEYKIIETLLLSGKTDEAQQRYDRFIQKWGQTTYPPDKAYVTKAQTLMSHRGQR